MRLVSRASTCFSAALLSAAWLTVLVSVAADVTAGSHPAHIAAVAAIATALGVARSVEGGRHRLAFGLLSSLVVAQPVLHAADVITLGSLREASGGADGDSAQSFAYVLLTVLLIVGVGAAEVVTHATWSGLRALSRLVRLVLASAPIDAVLVLSLSRIAVPRPRRQVWYQFARRRGPPARVAT